MKKVSYFLITAIIVIIAVILILLLGSVQKKSSLSPSINLSECNIISGSNEDGSGESYGESSNFESRINIVFLSSEENARKFSNYLLSTEPFSSNKGSFSIFYIDKELECGLYNGIALFCYNKENLKTASSCPNDYIIAVKSEDSEIRSSSYMNFMSINSNHPPNVIPHEFSHVFASLADEYVPAALPRKSENCVRNCDEFQKETDGCFAGCSLSNYYRSIDYGIMRSLTSSDFGIFNKEILSERINEETGAGEKAETNKETEGATGESPSIRGSDISSVTGRAIDEETSEIIAGCSEESYYLVEGTYKEGIIAISRKALEKGCAGKNGFGEFSYDLLLDNGDVYKDGSFNPELIFAESQPEGTSEITGEHIINDGPFYLKIPVIDNAKSLTINKDNIKIAEITLNDNDAVFCEV